MVFGWIGAAALVLGAAAQMDEELPRRGGIGAGLAPSAGGLAIASTPEGSPADLAGLEAGDVIISIGGRAVSDWLSFQAATAGLPVGEEVVFEIQRSGEALALPVTPTPLPAPGFDGARVELASVGSPGRQARTITLVPETASDLERDGRAPAVYFIQGIPCQAIDNFSNPDHYRVRLFRRLVDAGFVVAMADKPGVGDSQGEPCLDGGFNREVTAFTAAAQALAAREDVDPERVYAVGVSMGGIQAPLIAKQADLAGIVTWGTGVSPWFDYLATNFRMRAVIQGQPAAQSDPALRNMRLILADLLIDEMSPAEVREARPEAAAAFETSFGPMDRFAGRHITFHQELDEADIWGAWQVFDGRLLAVHGAFDWVASEHDHRLAVEAVNLNRPGDAEFLITPGLDHAMTSHGTLADSFAAPFQGAQSNLFHDAAVGWLIEQASG